ncbi:MAG: hypothetical protein KAW49_12870 [Anaerolineae bacterium]|nr:hypothetical protein [Anaerolineae bacterium]MCK4472664.1 hypothetical protein [Anaerolineae bacterium]
MKREIVTEATVLDRTHLVLTRPLPESWEQRLLVRITPVHAASEHLLRELRVAYLMMSEQERQAEVAMAEEGLWAQPDLAEAFPEEAEWPWWE